MLNIAKINGWHVGNKYNGCIKTRIKLRNEYRNDTTFHSKKHLRNRLITVLYCTYKYGYIPGYKDRPVIIGKIKQ